MKKYLVMRWKEVSGIMDKEGNYLAVFIQDLNDAKEVVEWELSEYLNGTLIPNSIKIDEEKMELRFKYYDNWDVDKEYPEEGYFDLMLIERIKDVVYDRKENSLG